MDMQVSKDESRDYRDDDREMVVLMFTGERSTTGGGGGGIGKTMASIP